MEFRAYQPYDKEGVITLIDAVYQEYGDRVHLEGSEADLNDVSSHYRAGGFMVLDDSGTIRGTVAVAPATGRPGVAQLKRLYLDRELRGSGWGERMLTWAADTARQAGLRRLELWSDTRFKRAHAFYVKAGFQHDGLVRTMHDSWQPYREYFYYRQL